MAGYVTTVLAFVHAELRTPEASSFCDFRKISSSIFIAFYFLYFTQANICFWDVLGKEWCS